MELRRNIGCDDEANNTSSDYSLVVDQAVTITLVVQKRQPRHSKCDENRKLAKMLKLASSMQWRRVAGRATMAVNGK